MRPVLGRFLCQTVVLTLALGFVACTDTDTPLNPSVRALFTTPTGLVTANPPQIFVGAGDISSCSNTGDEATAKLLDAIPDPATVYNIGDDAYDNGTTSEFANCYNPTWGRHKYRTKPTPGNHEYNTSGATPYYAYFGAAAGPAGVGYYSFNLGAWHIISLNSNVSRSVGSAQDTWLANDLAAHPNQCTLAYWHHPLYSSTGGTGSGGVSIASMQPFWNRLYAAHADLVLNGHRHFYERLKPMKPDGSLDLANGITEIIAGSGGIGGGSETNLFPTHVTGDGSTFGVLKLYLYDDSFAWKFIPVAGKTYTDSGSTACHSSGGGGGGPGPVDPSKSTVSANPTSFTAGSGSSAITVTARDASNNLLSGSSVTLASTGSGNTFTPSSGTTNGSGQFTSTFTSTVAEGKTISANIDGTAITQTPNVTVTPSGGGGGGTIAQTMLTSGGSGVNSKTYTTASIAPSANALVTVAVLGKRSSGALTPTISGGGISTWTQVASVDYDPIGVPTSRLLVFRGMSASPGTGAITITYTSSVSNAAWMVSQWTGVDQTGTNGSGAIGQTGPIAGDGVTSLSKTLAAFGSANNVGFGVVGVSANPPFVTPGAGSSEIGEVGSTESTDLETQSGVNDNTVAATLSASDNAGLLAIEIKAGGGGAPVVSATNSTVSASPGSITAGGSGSTITVTALDGSNNPIAGAAVVLSSTGSGNSFTAIGLTNNSGQATSTFTSTKAEGKVISATINSVAINQKPPVTVTPAPPAGLVFSGQPTNAQANAPIAPAVVVQVVDAFGNLTSSGASVGMAIGTDPSGSATLAGTTSQSAVNGVATFADLSINNTGTGYKLAASAATLTGATSSAFNITQPAPSPTNSTVSAATPSFTAGGSSAINIVVKDGLGNVMPGVAVTLSSSVVGDVITQPAITDGGGATSGTVAATAAGSHTITAVAGGVTLNQKPVLTVGAGAPDPGQSSFTASPLTITQTTGSSNLTVTVRDQYGNPVTGSNVTFSASPAAGASFTGGGLTLSSGVATGTMSSTVAEVKTVTAAADGTPIVQTQNIMVTPPSSGITQALLTAGSDITNQKIYTTASIAPAANALITIAVIGHTSTTASLDPTITGGGMSSWTVVASTTLDPQGATAHKRLTVFRAMSGAPGSGPITISFPTTESNAAWVVSQWTGVDQTGSNGSGAIVQTKTAGADAGTSIATTLNALGSPNNVAYGVVGTNGSALGITPGAGFTEISEQKPAEGTNSIIEALFATNQTAVSANWSGAFNAALLAVEIKAGP
ncbi:MAG TPA: Ig-like domain-containing protein [Gemmatimonadales bacterium]|nr:Ig-like domain-containing protein [Gemmatimonadales bacterium]